MLRLVRDVKVRKPRYLRGNLVLKRVVLVKLPKILAYYKTLECKRVLQLYGYKYRRKNWEYLREQKRIWTKKDQELRNSGLKPKRIRVYKPKRMSGTRETRNWYHNNRYSENSYVRYKIQNTSLYVNSNVKEKKKLLFNDLDYLRDFSKRVSTRYFRKNKNISGEKKRLIKRSLLYFKEKEEVQTDGVIEV